MEEITLQVQPDGQSGWLVAWWDDPDGAGGLAKSASLLLGRLRRVGRRLVFLVMTLFVRLCLRRGLACCGIRRGGFGLVGREHRRETYRREKHRCAESLHFGSSE